MLVAFGGPHICQSLGEWQWPVPTASSWEATMAFPHNSLAVLTLPDCAPTMGQRPRMTSSFHTFRRRAYREATRRRSLGLKMMAFCFLVFFALLLIIWFPGMQTDGSIFTPHEFIPLEWCEDTYLACPTLVPMVGPHLTKLTTQCSSST